MRAWLDSVAKELALMGAAKSWQLPLPLETIYLGGGTPSMLGLGAVEELASRLRRFFAWEPDGVEWTAEANPESFDRALADDWRAAGVNRVSLGVQSFHPPALRWMGRLHGPEGARGAVAAARGAGFGSVNVDLIFGLPERLGRDWEVDLDSALALEPEHVSLYGLSAEPGAPLGRRVLEKRDVLPDEEVYASEYRTAHQRLTAAGFGHYEVSNFARPGKRSRHNAAYWTGAAYLGVGPSAHSFEPPLRRWNLRDWRAYRCAVEDGQLPVEGVEELAPAERALEQAWLGFRTQEGVALAGAGRARRELARRWEAAGWAGVTASRLRLTVAGWLLLDQLAVEWAAAEEPSRAVA